MNNLDSNQIELTEEEKPISSAFGLKLYQAHKAALREIVSFNNPYSFASFYCNYIKELEKMKKEIKNNLKNDDIPLGLNVNLYNQFLISLNTIKTISLEETQPIYEEKFGESFHTYITEDGKLKGFFQSMTDSWKM